MHVVRRENKPKRDLIETEETSNIEFMRGVNGNLLVFGARTAWRERTFDWDSIEVDVNEDEGSAEDGVKGLKVFERFRLN